MAYLSFTVGIALKWRNLHLMFVKYCSVFFVWIFFCIFDCTNIQIDTFPTAFIVLNASFMPFLEHKFRRNNNNFFVFYIRKHNQSVWLWVPSVLLYFLLNCFFVIDSQIWLEDLRLGTKKIGKRKKSWKCPNIAFHLDTSSLFT